MVMMELCCMVEAMKGTYLQINTPDLYSKKYNDMIKTLEPTSDTDEDEPKQHISKHVRQKQSDGQVLVKRETRAAHPKHKKREKRQHKRSIENMFPPIENIGGGVSRILDITGPPVNYRSKDVATPYIGYMSKTGSISPDQKQSNVFRNITESNQEGKLDSVCTTDIIPRLALSMDKKYDKGNDRGKTDRKLNANKQAHVADINSNSSPKLRMTNANLRTLSNNRTNRVTSKDLPPKPPPIKSSDGTFSIRKKIEQFRQWHEEQYKDKIKKLKQEVDDQYEFESKKVAKSFNKSCENLLTLPTVEDSTLTSKVAGESSPEANERHEDNKEVNVLGSDEESRSDSPERAHSPRTWKTWRDINDSYAYEDVKKYIEENELLTTEKVTWIKQWIVDVDKAKGEDLPHIFVDGYAKCATSEEEPTL